MRRLPEVPIYSSMARCSRKSSALDVGSSRPLPRSSWQWDDLHDRELDQANALLAAVAPDELTTWRASASRWLECPWNGIFAIRTRGGAVISLFLSTRELAERRLSLLRLRYVQLGLPGRMVSLTLMAAIELARIENCAEVRIMADACNDPGFARNMAECCGGELGFVRSESGAWTTDLMAGRQAGRRLDSLFRHS